MKYTINFTGENYYYYIKKEVLNPCGDTALLLRGKNVGHVLTASFKQWKQCQEN